MNPVFILGLFDTGYYAARMLRNLGIPIIGFDYSRENPGFYSKYIIPFLIPNPDSQPGELLQILLEKRKRFKEKPLLLPASEPYLEFIRTKWQELYEEFLFCVPSPDVLSAILKKSDQIGMAEKAGIDVPKYHIVEGRADLYGITRRLSFPIIVKGINPVKWKAKVPQKALVANDIEEIEEISARLLSNDISFVAQEIVPGEINNNYEYNALMLNGKLIQAHVIQKKQQYPLYVGSACCIQTVKNIQVEELGFRFITTNRLEGFSNTEFKLDSKNGTYYFIETNARIWQQIELTSRCGGNLIRTYYNHMTHQGKYEAATKNPNAKIWVDLPPYLLLLIRYKKMSGLSYIEALRTLVRAKQYGLISIHDPRPFLHSVGVIQSGR